MLRVTIELLPYGSEEEKITIATGQIINTGTSLSSETGNYFCEFQYKQEDFIDVGKGRVNNYRRVGRNVWNLVLLALKNSKWKKCE